MVLDTLPNIFLAFKEKHTTQEKIDFLHALSLAETPWDINWDGLLNAWRKIHLEEMAAFMPKEEVI